MTWLTNVPRGDLLPKNEVSRFQANWNYIQAQMKDDHFWNESGDNDGHHKKVEMTSLEDAAPSGITIVDGDPDNLSTNMIGMIYMRPKTATEAPDGEFNEPFYAMNDGSRMQYLQLGFRAMVHFELSGSTVTIKYSHNVSSVTRQGVGDFKMNFSVQMPTNNYIAFGTAMRGTRSNGLIVSPIISATKSNSFNVDFFRFKTFSTSNSPRDPIVVTVAIIGG